MHYLGGVHGGQAVLMSNLDAGMQGLDMRRSKGAQSTYNIAMQLLYRWKANRSDDNFPFKLHETFQILHEVTDGEITAENAMYTATWTRMMDLLLNLPEHASRELVQEKRRVLKMLRKNAERPVACSSPPFVSLVGVCRLPSLQHPSWTCKFEARSCKSHSCA